MVPTASYITSTDTEGPTEVPKLNREAIYNSADFRDFASPYKSKFRPDVGVTYSKRDEVDSELVAKTISVQSITDMDVYKGVGMPTEGEYDPLVYAGETDSVLDPCEPFVLTVTALVHGEAPAVATADFKDRPLLTRVI